MIRNTETNFVLLPFHQFMEYDFIDLSSGSITLALAVILLCLKMPSDSQWRAMRRMLRLLSVCYFCIGVSNLITGCIGVSKSDNTEIGIAILLIALFQALFLTATCMVFVSPNSVKVKWLTVNTLLCTTVCAASIYALMQFDGATQVVWAVDTVLYIIQLVYYCILFKRCYTSCVKALEENYDDDMSDGLRWIRNCFLGALSVGISALLFGIFRWGGTMYSIFTCVYTLYYVYLVACVINYRIKAGYIVKVVATENTEITEAEEQPTTAVQHEKESAEEMAYDEHHLHQAIEEWVRERKFVKNDQTVEEIAHELGTTHTVLKWYFTNRMHTTFRTWRIALRIEEAQRLLRDEKVPVTTVHKMVGVADKSNFHKQFRQITGMTPREFAECH